MRFYPPIYPEDGMQQPGIFPGGDAADVSKTGAIGAHIVHGTIGAESLPEPEVDVATLERQARAARSA